MIRQLIMCRADTSLYPMYWSETREAAEVEVGLPKKCVDFDAVMIWAKEHEIGEHRIKHFDPGSDVVWPKGQAPAMRSGRRFH
jgi:hypothetical protein